MVLEEWMMKAIRPCSGRHPDEPPSMQLSDEARILALLECWAQDLLNEQFGVYDDEAFSVGKPRHRIFIYRVLHH
jgi:hypothetical protein